MFFPCETSLEPTSLHPLPRDHLVLFFTSISYGNRYSSTASPWGSGLGARTWFRVHDRLPREQKMLKGHLPRVTGETTPVSRDQARGMRGQQRPLSSTQGSSWGYLKVNSAEILSSFGDKCPQNGSRNDLLATRTTLECPHEGPSVVYHPSWRDKWTALCGPLLRETT